MSSMSCCTAENAGPKVGLLCSSRLATAVRTRPNSCVRTPCSVETPVVLCVQDMVTIVKAHKPGQPGHKSVSTVADLPPLTEASAAEEMPEEPQFTQSLKLLCFLPPVRQQHATCRLPSRDAHDTVCRHDEVLRRICILGLDNNKVVRPPCSDICLPA